MLFVLAQNEDKACTNIHVLHEAFVTSYTKEYPDFKAFLSDILNQKRKFSQEELDKWKANLFKLNKMIEKKYNNLNLPDFNNAYFDNTVNNQKLVVESKFIDEEHLYSLLYFCFINSYNITLVI